MPRLVLLAAVMLSAACQTLDQTPETSTLLISGFDPNLSPPELTAQCARYTNQAQTAFAELESATEPATMTSVIGQFDEIAYEMQPIVHTYHLMAVHPDAQIRDAARACTTKIDEFFNGTGLSRAYYQRVADIRRDGLEPTEIYLLDKTLRNFELAGVNRDEKTRTRIKALRDEISQIGKSFRQNIREDVRSITVTPEQLEGLPKDYLAARPPDENGEIRISTEYPDMVPVLTYAHDDTVRKALRNVARNRGYPVNKEVLEDLLGKRHELAQLLGYENYAQLSMKKKMMGDPDRASEFLTAIRKALDGPLQREKNIFLNRLRKIYPEADEVQAWQFAYLSQLLRQEDYALDAQLVRTYFSYDRVRDGIFQLVEDLFEVSIEPWETETWHADVETYQLIENGKIIGRFYMDNHPRPDKYQHAAHWTIRAGIKDRQIPLSALAQNFPKGLMEHGQVETFLHEFGHLIHNMFSGTQRWGALSGMSMERDFVEAPSQMLEEWIWDYDTLRQFAINDAGEPIPKALVEKMNRARDFSRAISTTTQVFYARLALDIYTRPPDSFDLDELLKNLADTYSPFPFVEGTYFYASFGHLYGYASDYYTYQWSLAIANDLFSRFKKEGLRNLSTARDYRRFVLGAAGSKPADEFVADFLGREFSIDAYLDWLNSL